MSIRLRLTIWYTSILAAMLLVFGTGLYWGLDYKLNRDMKRDLERAAMNVIQSIDLRPSFFGRSVSVSLPDVNAFQSSNVFIQIVNTNLHVVARSSNLGNSTIVLPQAHYEKSVNSSGPFYETISLSGNKHDLVTLYVPMRIEGQFFGLLQATSSMESIDRLLDQVLLLLGVGAALTIVLAASFGWFLARKALSPIDSIITAANRIEAGQDLQTRIEYKGPQDEIGRLVLTINGMLERIQHAYTELDEAYRAQRRFVSDASHELRTPLTTIRGNVDLLEKMWKKTRENMQLLTESGEGDPDDKRAQVEMSLEAMRDIAAESERMSRLVNDMLSLARADVGIRLEKEPVELKPMVEEVVRRAAMLPRKAEWIPGDLSPLEGLRVIGSRDHLQQLLFIFIENAFKYTPSGWVRLDVQREGNQIGFRIEDTGIGMDKDEVPHIFERFYRADPSRGKTSGTGLGLSIAKWIIDEHGGSVEVFTRLDEGTAFVIWLPLAEERPSASDPPL
ncbi:sensor histidine kinase [Paenibacillus thermoaerophilus]|uniref:histidine kinase n=1 Tax=Paenibacillus thermoaerophilus TaxID=1215385 RepID=A0ABW2V5T3_9BACL|nr:HAMP domain-containing sensor histidine kinase [Paenibacillus thermoaerophilus]TMV18472.1 HAMP domain-containing histidine kinase [Paenibacillus thermoaerophilus]